MSIGYLQGRGIHVDKHLTQIVMNYRPTGWIADMIFPVIRVDKQTDMIKTYNQADLYRQENTKRSPGTEANLIGFEVGSDSYICQNFALKTNVTVEDRANADPAFIRDLESGRVEFTTDHLKLDWEVRVATQVTNSSNVSTQAQVASAWTTANVPNANADPLGDIWAVADAVQDATGYRPNNYIFSTTAWRGFSRNNNVIDKIHKTGVTGGAMPIVEAEAARLLEAEKVMVASAYKNTAQEGLALNLSQVWGDNLVMYYTPGRPSVDFPSFGYAFNWRKPGLAAWNVERHPFDRKKKSDEVEVGYYQDEKITSTALAALISWTGCSQ